MAELVARRETPSCAISQSLSDAVDAMVSAKRTAAVVLDEEQVQGLAQPRGRGKWECWKVGGAAELCGNGTEGV